jgi:hypothetical protein
MKDDTWQTDLSSPILCHCGWWLRLCLSCLRPHEGHWESLTRWWVVKKEGLVHMCDVTCDWLQDIPACSHTLYIECQLFFRPLNVSWRLNIYSVPPVLDTAKSYILICTCLHPYPIILMRQKVLYKFGVCLSQRKIENWLLQTHKRGVSRTGAPVR